MRLRLILCGVLLFFSGLAGGASKPPAAAIATAHPLATDAGLEILRAGGNAFDAAAAVTAALGVVEPYSSGLGGGGFWLLHRAEDGAQIMLDGRERAPLAATRDMFVTEEGGVSAASLNGPLSAGIPGVPAAVVHLATRYGRLGVARVLAPAIRLARDGFKVSPHYRRMAGVRLPQLRRYNSTATVFLYRGEVPPPGHVIRQPDLAATLERIAEHGRAGFYDGRTADLLVTGVRAAGGIWDLADLASYQVKEREPVVGEVQGARVVSASPPSSGGIALLTMLNILEGYDLSAGDGAVAGLHPVVETMRRAYHDRARHLGDPDFWPVPSEALLSDEHAGRWRSSIDPRAATPSATLGPLAPLKTAGADTSHFSVVDRDGNRVAATLSINYPFGSGYVVPGTGILLNDEMDDFSAIPGAPNAYGLVGAEANAIAGGKRPLSSMTPTFIETDERVAVLGTPGGSRIITMVLLAGLDFLRGGTAETMVGLPRYHHQYLPDRIVYEDGAFDEAARQGLEALGHRLEPVGPYGNMQVVVWDRLADHIDAASDPRGEGRAAMY